MKRGKKIRRKTKQPIFLSKSGEENPEAESSKRPLGMAVATSGPSKWPALSQLKWPKTEPFRLAHDTERSQTQTPAGNWVKRDTTNGRFMDVKTVSKEPFKGVRKEK